MKLLVMLGMLGLFGVGLTGCRAEAEVDRERRAGRIEQRETTVHDRSTGETRTTVEERRR